MNRRTYYRGSSTIRLIWTPWLAHLQVYSSTEHLATPSNLSFSSDRSHSEDKEDRSDVGGLSPSPTPAEGSVEGRNAGRMARSASKSRVDIKDLM